MKQSLKICCRSLGADGSLAAGIAWGFPLVSLWFLEVLCFKRPESGKRAEALPLAAIPVVQDTQWYRVFTQTFCERVGTLTGGMEI